MNEKYLEKLEQTISLTRPRLKNSFNLEFKNSFGAVAGFLDGQIFIVSGKFGLALRLPAEQLVRLFESKSVRRFKYFKNGHVKKDYAIIPKKLLEDRVEMKKLMNHSIKFAVKNAL